MFDCYDTLITPEEVADMLGCGMNTTYKLLKSGKIKAMRLFLQTVGTRRPLRFLFKQLDPRY